MVTTSIHPHAPFSLIRGCSLMGRGSSRYYLGTLGRVVEVTSAFERTALYKLANRRDPFEDTTYEIRNELEIFLERLAALGFLNANQSPAQTPPRFFDHISESDLAVNHLQARSALEFLQSEWVDNASDGGVSTVQARANYPVALSGRGRVISILYSILLASGVSRARFLDRFDRPTIDSLDLGAGLIPHSALGLNYYEESEMLRRSASLFPIEPFAHFDRDFSKPAIVAHFGDCDLELLHEWSNNSIPHLLIHAPVGDEVAVGPTVIPGKSPCIRCLSLYEIDNFGYTRLERINLTEDGDLPFVIAHYVASIAASQILHFIDQRDDVRNTGIGEVTYINFQKLTEPQVVAIARHPLCGCDQ